MSDPQTCGAAGGAISLWFRVINCFVGAIITSISNDTVGSLMLCSTDYVR